MVLDAHLAADKEAAISTQITAMSPGVKEWPRGRTFGPRAPHRCLDWYRDDSDQGQDTGYAFRSAEAPVAPASSVDVLAALREVVIIKRYRTTPATRDPGRNTRWISYPLAFLRGYAQRPHRHSVRALGRFVVPLGLGIAAAEPPRDFRRLGYMSPAAMAGVV